MATQEQIDALLTLLEEIRPIDTFHRMNEMQAGFGAVLRYLFETDQTVTAGQISHFMHVSTARVAVLLKKMEAKELITRQSGAEDARTTVVALSEKGRQLAREMQADMHAQVAAVIDRVGMERLLVFFETFREIRTTLKGPAFNIADRE